VELRIGNLEPRSAQLTGESAQIRSFMREIDSASDENADLRADT
jgi:hypothetical protein